MAGPVNSEHERDEKAFARLFPPTRTHAWQQAGLAPQINRAAVRKARWEALVVLPLLAGVLTIYSMRRDLFGPGSSGAFATRVITVVALVVLGWAVARDIGHVLRPIFFRRMDPATAGTVGFLTRLITILVTVLAALAIAGLDARTLAIGGGFTAVVLGLAAQQTLGNLIAGTVLLSARPFRVGEYIRIQGAGINAEGVVSSLGLLHTTMQSGEDRILVPNNTLLTQAIIPRPYPTTVDLRARLRADVKPSEVQALLDERVTTATRAAPEIALESLEKSEVVVRITATPEAAADNQRLADEILAAIGPVAAADGRPETELPVQGT